MANNVKKPFGITQFPVQVKEYRELLVANDFCPQCGGKLGFDFECMECDFNSIMEIRGMDLVGYHAYNMQITALDDLNTC